LAIIPGATLAELWRGLSRVDLVLRAISFMVLAIGLASMVSTLLAGLNERRREMAILRSLGASPSKIAGLLVFESFCLTGLGVGLGLVIQISGFWSISRWLESEFGFFMTGPLLTVVDGVYLSSVLVVGLLAGLIPAWRARDAALKDGLTIRV
jgi:putative ABC transport system permease protein